jgi:hypothetical protein
MPVRNVSHQQLIAHQFRPPADLRLTLTARIVGRLPAEAAARLRALVAVDVPDDEIGDDSVLALIKSVPGNVGRPFGGAC